MKLFRLRQHRASRASASHSLRAPLPDWQDCQRRYGGDDTRGDGRGGPYEDRRIMEALPRRPYVFDVGLLFNKRALIVQSHLAAVVGGDLARGGYQILQRGGWRSEEVARELLKAASLNRRIERGFEKWISTSIVATCLGLVFLAAEILLMSALT